MYMIETPLRRAAIIHPTINPTSAPRPRRERDGGEAKAGLTDAVEDSVVFVVFRTTGRGLSSKIALTAEEVHDDGYLLLLKTD